MRIITADLTTLIESFKFELEKRGLRVRNAIIDKELKRGVFHVDDPEPETNHDD